MHESCEHRIFGFDLIRAIAILLVLCSHSTLLIFPHQVNLMLTVIRFFGSVGVDLFFVLSGYLIGNIILKQLTTGKTRFQDFLYFWIRRWFRTLPNYYLILTLNLVIFYVLDNRIADSLARFIFFLQNFAWPHPDFFTESWSLSVEEYAYIIAPLFIMLLLMIFKNSDKDKLFLKGSLAIILLVMLLRLYFNYNHNMTSMHDWSQNVRKVVIYRLDSIYYGFIGAYVMNAFKNSILKYKRDLLYLGILMFMGLHLSIFNFDLQPNNASLLYNIFYLPLLSVSLLLFFPICVNLKTNEILKRKITIISVLSYGLYLINYSLIVLVIQYFVDVESQSLEIKLLLLISYWFLSFVFAALLYRFFEKPILDFRESSYIKKLFSN